MDEQNIANQKIKPLHTYTSDMADAVREQEATVIKIALAEKQKREAEAETVIAKKSFSMNIFYVIGGILFLCFAIWGTIFLIEKGKQASSIEAKKTQVDTLVQGDSQTILDITSIKTKDELKNAIVNVSKKEIKNKTIESIVLVTVSNNVSTFVKTSDFIKLAEIKMPGSLSRNLAEDFMIGVYNDDSQNHTFIIFRMNDYDQAFASMLSWEPNILSDMFNLLNVDVSSVQQNIFETPWKDKIIENKDSRILVDDLDHEILTYMFLGKDKVIITNNEPSIKAVLQRLVTQNIKSL